MRYSCKIKISSHVYSRGSNYIATIHRYGACGPRSTLITQPDSCLSDTKNAVKRKQRIRKHNSSRNLSRRNASIHIQWTIIWTYGGTRALFTKEWELTYRALAGEENKQSLEITLWWEHYAVFVISALSEMDMPFWSCFGGDTEGILERTPLATRRYIGRDRASKYRTLVFTKGGTSAFVCWLEIKRKNSLRTTGIDWQAGYYFHKSGDSKPLHSRLWILDILLFTTCWKTSIL